MIDYRNPSQMNQGTQNWLNDTLRSSFADYFDSQNIRMGPLHVVNDGLVAPRKGFPMHPHRDMDMISYVIDGTLTHTDDRGNQSRLTRGQAQYMCAGTGIQHSEYNQGHTPMRYIQLWFYPENESITPYSRDVRLDLTKQPGKWIPLATGTRPPAGVRAPIFLHADANVFVSVMPRGAQQYFPVGPNRQAYLVLLEGEAIVSGRRLRERDAVKLVREDVQIDALRDAHILLVETQWGY